MNGEFNSDNAFEQALAESGVKVVGQESTSTEEQEQQASTEASTSNEPNATTTEQHSGETQETVVGAQGTEESSEGTGENPTLETGGESERKSGFIDLNPSTEESATEEQSQASTNEFNTSEMFGEQFESVDDVRSALESYNDLVAKVEKLETKTPEFANEFVQKMNEFVMKGGDPVQFAKVQSVNVDNLSPIDALKMDLQWEHGITEEEALAYINQKYDMDDFDEDSGAINPSAVQLKIDSKNAKENLKSRQADNTLVTPKGEQSVTRDEIEQYEQAQAQEKEAADNVRMWDESKGWAKEVDKSLDNLKENGVILDMGNGKGFRFSYDKDDSYTEELVSKVDQALYDSGMSKEDNPVLAKQLMEDIFWLENRNDIMKAYGDEIKSMKTEEYHKMYNNPSAVSKGDPVDDGAKPLSAEEQMNSIWKNG
jgi:hypothetical protein